MTADIEQARQAIARCSALRQQAKVEAVLRGEFHSWLRKIFPEQADERWIDHYGEGAEALTKIATGAGTDANRFIDNLIGSTTIEYEADLRNKAKFDEGYRQVREHAAGLIRKGVPVSQVRGVLSDTVEWHAYDVELDELVDPAGCTPDDVQLKEFASLDTSAADDEAAERLTLFVRAHLAREQSRLLYSSNLSLDLGLESLAYGRNLEPLRGLVTTARAADGSAELASTLWSRFVDHLEGEAGDFRVEPYVDELYLNILARLLSASALAGIALSSDEAELRAILDGSHFRNQYQLENLVERDYFGWITSPEHIGDFMPIAREIQRDLYAYDFSWRPEQDLFGRLMAQLARRSQRKLLGQEWTPAWLARHLADRVLSEIPEGQEPQIVDMCCGSGAILAEIINSARENANLSGIESLRGVATGFDIDPLAVAFAKTTWVLALAEEIKAAAEPVTIPIYHADSLFAVTPVSASLPMMGAGDTINITLDGQSVTLPAALVQPEYRELFDHLVDWAYDEALDQESDPPSAADADQVLETNAANLQISLSPELRASVSSALLQLATRMKELAAAGRNGIWAFILRNTYRPGLLAGQFNGLVSNPPWLAMSALADNPYRAVLKQRADLYGITPAGSSFLHLELGTTHLLHAVDRYLQPGAAVACLVPGTLLNGTHHQKFRQRAYLSGDRSVPLQIDEVWQVAPGTFKYPSVAVIGEKAASSAAANQDVETGRVVKLEGAEEVDFSVRVLSETRTAWLLEKGGKPALAQNGQQSAKQGADIMPRRSVCIEIVNSTGNEYRVKTPTREDQWGFTVKQAKELQDETFPGHAAPDFIYDMAQSENLLPFILGVHRAPVALPAMRNPQGTWQFYKPADVRRMGFRNTAKRFAEINDKLSGDPLEERIDYRLKLSNQVFGDGKFLVLSGAGGTYICAACIPTAEAERLVIDQTLYWQEVDSEQDAWFRTGILNSNALTQAILPFNPEGDFGPRHIHTLPYQLMPAYDPANNLMRSISEAAEKVAAVASSLVAKDNYVNDASKSLSHRRRRLREQLIKNADYQELDQLCAVLLGIDSAKE